MCRHFYCLHHSLSSQILVEARDKREKTDQIINTEPDQLKNILHECMICIHTYDMYNIYIICTTYILYMINIYILHVQHIYHICSIYILHVQHIYYVHNIYIIYDQHIYNKNNLYIIYIEHTYDIYNIYMISIILQHINNHNKVYVTFICFMKWNFRESWKK